MCLSAPSQSILVIENPEVHLHPSAQSKLADFFYYIAKSGRQVIIETHSDHVFNGIRAGVATKEIDREKVVVNFVYKKENQPTECEEILFGDNGRIVNPRKDLFDQFDLDLNRMLGVADGINI